jgi:TRIC channel
MGVFGGMMKKAAEDARVTPASEFHGIPLKSDITDSPPETLIYLGLVLLWILVLQPRLQLFKSPVVATVAWAAIVAVLHAIKEVTLHPLISTILFTRTTYPYPLVVAHCINANAGYRQERGSNCHYLESFGVGFLAYGFGGTIVSDLLMGLPITALQHVRILPVWTIAWALVWFCPGDYIYKVLQDKKNSGVYYFLNAFVAMDVVTTSMGRVSRSARELPNKWTSPIVAGTLSGIGGACIRYLERRLLRGGDAAVQRDSLAAIETGFWRTLGYSTLWWYIAVYQCDHGSYTTSGQKDEHHCHEYTGHDMARLVLVMVHVAWTFACDMGLAISHPFVFCSRHWRNLGSHLAFHLGFGPPQWHRPDLYRNGEASHEKTD